MAFTGVCFYRYAVPGQSTHLYLEFTATNYAICNRNVRPSVNETSNYCGTSSYQDHWPVWPSHLWHVQWNWSKLNSRHISIVCNECVGAYCLFLMGFIIVYRFHSSRAALVSGLCKLRDNLTWIYRTVSRIASDHLPVCTIPFYCISIQFKTYIFDLHSSSDCLPFGIYMWTYTNMMHIMKTFMVITELDLRYTEEAKVRTGIQKRESMWLTVIAGSVAGKTDTINV